jgi:hypothetical protein
MEMLVIAVIALVAFAAVLVPLFRRRPGVGDDREFENIPQQAADTRATPSTAPGSADVGASVSAGAGGEAGAPLSADELELEVQRYRTAVRAGTVCRKCGQANPAESMFCFDCGERLPRDEAKEFE